MDIRVNASEEQIAEINNILSGDSAAIDKAVDISGVFAQIRHQAPR